MQRIFSLAAALAAAHTPNDVARAMVRLGVENMEASAGVFARPDAKGLLQIIAQHGQDEVFVSSGGSPSGAAYPMAAAAESGRAVWMDGFVVLPLVIDQETVAVAAFSLAHDRAFSADERALMETMASLAAQAFRRAELHEHEVVTRRRLEALGELTEALSKALTLPEVVDVVLDRGMKAAGADSCTLYLFDETARALTLIGHRGVNPQILDRIGRITAESGNPVFFTLENGRILFAENQSDYEKLYPELAKHKTEGPRAQAFWSVPVIAEGKPIGLLGMGFYAPRLFPPEERDFVQTFTRHCAEALRRAELLAQQRREVFRRSFLAQAATVLSESLDYETTLSRVASLVVPGLADWCTVDLVDGSPPRAKRVAVAHVDPAKVVFAREWAAKYPPNPDATSGVPNVLRSGRPELYSDISDELLEASAPDEEYLRILRELRLRSAMLVPLTARGRVLGVMTFVYADAHRHYTEDDLRFAEIVAQRCAIAIDNALLFAAERRAHQIADIANHAKDDFLVTVSHELKTPLTAILSWAKLLRAPGTNDVRRKHAVETIERNAGAMAELVDELLDMSSLVSGRIDLQTQPVDLCKTIDSAIDSIRAASEAKQIRVDRTFDGDAVVVTGDPARIRQIIWNLVANAVKFTNPGGRVAINLSRLESFAQLTVMDSGKGIEPTFMPYLFDPFRQEVLATARARGGLGLGLAITRRLVELHGGTIEAKSDGPGRGSTFTITLPLGSGDIRTASERPRG